MKSIPSLTLPVIKNGKFSNEILTEIMKDKKIIIFGVPGAFTPTCSEQHLPGFINNIKKFKNKKIDEIYCISVNDVFVMKAWLDSYQHGNTIIGIADGNGQFAKEIGILEDYSKNFMGKRSKRFAIIANNNLITNFYIEKRGQLSVSSSEYILNQL